MLSAAKNVILAGVRSVTVHDKCEVTKRDLSAQFYLNEADIGKNRAEGCREQLQELNTGVAVASSSADLGEDFLAQFQVRDRSARPGVQGYAGRIAGAAIHGSPPLGMLDHQGPCGVVSIVHGAQVVLIARLGLSSDYTGASDAGGGCHRHAAG